MRYIVIVGLAGLLTATSAFAQPEGVLSQKVDQIMDACMAKANAGEIKTRVETITCLNDGMTRVYRQANWPYMDTVYQFEATAILSAAQADAGKITQEEYAAQVSAAMLQFNGELAKRSREQSLAAQQEAQRQNDIAAQNREANRRALLRAYLQNGSIFH